MSYVIYDDLGLKEVHCMNCNEIVATRKLVDAPDGSDNKVIVIQQLGNYRQVEMPLLDRGDKEISYINPIVCAECEKVDLDPIDIMNKVRVGWDEEMKSAGVNPINRFKYINKYRNIKAGKKVVSHGRNIS